MGRGSAQVVARVLVAAAAVAGAASVAVVTLTASLSRLAQRQPSPQQLATVPASYGGLHHATYPRADSYPTLVGNELVEPVEDRVYGGTVSHHFYVEPQISRYFLSLRSQRPDTVVLVGPNHHDVGSADVLVSRYPYRTAWGNVEPNLKVVDELIASGLAKNEERPFETEHAISVPVGFMARVFPGARLVPVVLKRDVDPSVTAELAALLERTLPERSLVIASVDFSHHLGSVAASFHDAESLATVSSFDYASLPNLEVDSPPSLDVLLRYLEMRGAQRGRFERYSSALASGNEASTDVTSYLFSSFTLGKPTGEPAVSLLHFGDTMLGRLVGRRLEAGIDPFSKIGGVEGNFLRGIDVIALNLEGPITSRQSCAPKEILFTFNPKVASLLSRYGVDFVTVANNHSLDCGRPGLADTQRHLAEAGVGYFGEPSDRPYVTTTISGARVALVGFNALGWGKADRYETLVSWAAAESDYVIVSIHWGDEYLAQPPASVRTLGHQLVEAGADVVVGHHPHVIQPVEVYRGKPIFYSLGNFIFDQVLPGTQQGLAVGAALSSSTQRFFLFPINIVNHVPEIAPYEQATSICAKVLANVSTTAPCILTLPFSDAAVALP